MGWNEINSDEDIRFLMDKTGSFIDAVLLSANYLTGNEKFTDCFGDERSTGRTLLLRVGSHICGEIELLFYSVMYFTMQEDLMTDCKLVFRDDLYGKQNRNRLLVLSLNESFDPPYRRSTKPFSLAEKHDTAVIAQGMKWRFAVEKSESDCLDHEYAPFT